MGVNLQPLEITSCGEYIVVSKYQCFVQFYTRIKKKRVAKAITELVKYIKFAVRYILKVVSER